ncbi:sodium:solute symporter [Gilvibacter sediminis]|uniref:sodium:solute symporter n=1 Tax=Gilvibacter sediminis TaxID=379071 RepID=UPI00234FFEAB|nr:sodium:solute symporter [Gilvibacter sediminis]MDC7998187.1 sodium:solute symporter [Gilvibacter sediminis]
MNRLQLEDWLVLATTLLFIVIYGAWKTRKHSKVSDYLRGGNSAKWWTVGISVMATQASAITFLSTPGQAFHDGMGFVQFYFGLPIAMIIICMVFIPLYHKLKVYTAYEFLEQRFDGKTRVLTAFLFLIQRGLSAGITIFAPAIILSAVLGWDLYMLNIIIGVLVIIYTVTGGTKAVSVTQKQQMAVIFAGMFIAFYLILDGLPEEVTFTKALDIAGASGKMDILDFSFDFENNYTVWSGIIGGTFLMLSYFGTDQSQVQRYLSGQSVKQSQLGLMFNGLLKVPMQFFILLVGVMVFVFYQYNSAPLHFNPSNVAEVMESPYADQYKSLENQRSLVEAELFSVQNAMAANSSSSENQELINQMKSLQGQDKQLREQAKELILKVDPNATVNDKDYVFIHYILNNLPKGLIGLLLAVILSAAMSSTASELNALGTTTTIDIYKRSQAVERDEKFYIQKSKWFTALWGVLAILIACVANLFENLIQLVNIIGSIFYGNVLGIFLLAFFIKHVKSRAVFAAAILTQAIIIALWFWDAIPYLWLNLIGCALVMIIAILFQSVDRKA